MTREVNSNDSNKVVRFRDTGVNLLWINSGVDKLQDIRNYSESRGAKVVVAYIGRRFIAIPSVIYNAITALVLSIFNVITCFSVEKSVKNAKVNGKRAWEDLKEQWIVGDIREIISSCSKRRKPIDSGYTAARAGQYSG